MKKNYRLLVKCKHCSAILAQYDFTFEELVDYVEKGKTRPKHWGWVVHEGHIYQGKGEKEKL